MRPEVNIDKCSLAADSHNGRCWIRSGLAKLPPELVQLVCRQLCLCWYCEPRPYPLIYYPDGFVKFRDALSSLSKTCRFLCAVAQPYLFHDIEGPSQDVWGMFKHHNGLITMRLLQTLDSRLPHMANQIRRISLNSIMDDFLLFKRLTGLRSLYVAAISAGGIGLESYLSFPCLHELHYGPFGDLPFLPSTEQRVLIEDARKDLRAILAAAPDLSHLSCQRLWHNVSLSPFILLKLPACRITTLELHQCWLPNRTFLRFMANFPRLKNFRLSWTMPSYLAYLLDEPDPDIFPSNEPERIADAADVIKALESCKETLERLDLDFGWEHEYDDSFRFLPSMKNFTSLRTLFLSQGAIGNHWLEDEVSTDAFTTILPSSIERLLIKDFREAYKNAVLDLAKQTAAGAYPNLGYVRLIGWYDDDTWWGTMSGQDFLTFASGQDVSRLPVGDDYIGVVNIELDIEVNTHQLLPGEEGEEEAEHQEASEQSGSEAGLDDPPYRQDWVLFGQRCLSNNYFMSNIARLVKEDSEIHLIAALQDLPSRKRIQRLFSREFVKFECVVVKVQDEDREYEVAYF